MEAAKTFEDLVVWQKAHQFVLKVYRLAREYPKEESYGLTSQFRRAAVSVASNIAEGFKKWGSKEKARYLNIAEASLEECRYYLLLTRDLEYCSTDEAMALLREVSSILRAYTFAVRKEIRS